VVSQVHRVVALAFSECRDRRSQRCRSWCAIPDAETKHELISLATGSDYFSFCFPLHISLESDLVVVDLAINDEGIPEHVENMENLLRGLLDLPRKPAVILMEILAFSNGGLGGGGGRMHL
jgi:hypothetical protein